MIKRFTVIAILVISSFAARAQQDPYYGHFMLNRLAFNPAVAGYKDAICANVLAHRQWIGYTDESLKYKTPSGEPLPSRTIGPQTYFGSVTMPIHKIKSGVGLTFMSDAVGYERTVNVKASYAYHHMFDNKNQVLQFGLDVGMLQKEFDGSYYNPRQLGDPLIPSGVTSGRIFDLGLGAFYNNYKLANLEVGVSATHLMGGTIEYQANGTQVTKVVPNIYVVASTSHPIGGGNIILQPNVWIKTIFSTTQVDLNCRALLNQLYVAGLTYRDGGNSDFLDAFSLQLGYYLQPQFYLGYAYDIPITRGLAGGGTHEIFATYCFRIKSKPPIQRWLIDQRHLGGYR